MCSTTESKLARVRPRAVIASGLMLLASLVGSATAVPQTAATAELILELEDTSDVTLVGALRRWDSDGNLRRPVDPKAKIEAPQMDAAAQRMTAQKWVFTNLPPGRYDLVILKGQKVRIEGFDFPPVLEFDPFFTCADRVPDEAREWIARDIAQSRHYENKVTPLFFAGDQKQIRVFVQLLRDQPTSYDSQYGEPVATLRHEVWQYTHRYGAWTKEQRTRVFDRVLAAKRELRQWSWVWEPSLGGIEVGQTAVVRKLQLPARLDPGQAKGLLPY